MRRPPPRRRRISRTASAPAPVRGLNARDALANMKPTDAVILDNFFPRTADVLLRNGCEVHTSGITGSVQSLMPWRGATSSKLFAAVGGSIYDVSVAGAVGVAAVSGLTSNRWQHVNMGTPGGQFLVCVNGADDMRQYDGSTWKTINGASVPAITGVSTASLIQVNLFKQRLFFVQKDSMNVWYLPVQSIAGAATKFDLSSLFTLGGRLEWMATWTLDTGAGVQEYAVFCSNQGQIAVYEGIDPSSATDWALIGMFRIGRPVIGRRSFEKIGSDLFIVCADGVVPLSRVLATDRSQTQSAVTDRVVNLMSEYVQLYGDNYGWDAILHPGGSKAIVNVPTLQDTTSLQLVMNSTTGAWCRFTGWNAFCFALLGDDLYYGGINAVYKADTGNDDAGSAIAGDMLPAFDTFGSSEQKRFVMVRPVVQANTRPRFSLAMCVDYSPLATMSTPTYTETVAAVWNLAPWNESDWDGVSRLYRDWQTIGQIGYAGAMRLKVSGIGAALSVQAIDYLYEQGEGVL